MSEQEEQDRFSKFDAMPMAVLEEILHEDAQGHATCTRHADDNKEKLKMKNIANKLKKTFCLALALALLSAPMVGAQEDAPSYEASDWARADVKKAIELGILHDSTWRYLPGAIQRGDFATQAASLVAIAFGSKLDSYCNIMNYRGLAETGQSPNLSPFQYAQDFGIIKGRENGDLDYTSAITRQEAAVMLARTYRAYHAKTPELVQPLSFVDQDEIADWAREDVQLMNQLGIMTGTTGNRFDPYGTYTREQSLVTLLRLHEKAPYDGSMEKNPFVIPVIEGGLSKSWSDEQLVFAFETGQYYIWSYQGTVALGSSYCYIEIIDQDLSRRTYRTAILEGASNRGDYHARPKNAYIAENGTKLIYTAVVEKDAYRVFTDWNTNVTTETLLFLKGVYTVTMDLKTGEQTYTRADLS